MYNTYLYIAMIHFLRAQYLGQELHTRLYPVQLGLNAYRIEV